MRESRRAAVGRPRRDAESSFLEVLSVHMGALAR
jgi:hypothetical protein